VSEKTPVYNFLDSPQPLKSILPSNDSRKILVTGDHTHKEGDGTNIKKSELESKEKSEPPKISTLEDKQLESELKYEQSEISEHEQKVESEQPNISRHHRISEKETLTPDNATHNLIGINAKSANGDDVIDLVPYGSSKVISFNRTKTFFDGKNISNKKHVFFEWDEFKQKWKKKDNKKSLYDCAATLKNSDIKAVPVQEPEQYWWVTESPASHTLQTSRCNGLQNTAKKAARIEFVNLFVLFHVV
jgi:hypothetical protein